MGKFGRSSQLASVATVLAVAMTVRVMFWDQLRFIATEPYAAQLIPLELLRDDPLASVWNFHSQPPLFNLFVAGIMHVFSLDESRALHASMVGLGLVSLTLLTLAILAVSGRPLIAMSIGCVFALLPSALAFESWLFYAQLELACTAAIALIIARIDERNERRCFLAFGVVGLLLTLVRSAYHPVWLIALLVGWLGSRALLLRRERANGPSRDVRTTRGWLVPLAVFSALTLAWPAKNQLQFGFFGSSSWLGMSLAKIAVYPLPLELRRRWVDAGTLSRYAIVAPFLPIEAYGPPPRSAPPAHPVLALPLNDERYIEVSETLARDAQWVITHEPSTYLTTAWLAIQRFFEPTTLHSAFMHVNMPVLAEYDVLFLSLLYPWGHVYLSVLAYFLPLLGGVAAWLAALCRRCPRSVGTQGLLLAGTLSYAFLVFNFTEWGENNRFRYTLLPLIVFGDVWMIVQLVRYGRVPHWLRRSLRFKAWRGARSGRSSSADWPAR